MSRTVLASACLLALLATPTAFAAKAPKPGAPMPAAAAAPAVDPALAAAIAGTWRTPENTVRDAYRHPSETLSFFSIAPTQTVIEITPSPGWYSEILAPYLRDGGRYIAAVVDPAKLPEKSRGYHLKSRAGLEAKFAANPAVYGKAQVVGFQPDGTTPPSFGAPGSADRVLTFRNVHNWRMAGQADAMFKGFFTVLKPGGVLGVVEHRAKADVPDGDKSGYVGEAQVIAMAEAAGFKLAGKSEANANPRDTKDYANGVWTLPPVNNHDASEQAKYDAIGESDRMTLRFVKP